MIQRLIAERDCPASAVAGIAERLLADLYR